MDAKEAIKLTAQLLHKTEEEVLRDIDRAVKRALANPNKRVQEFWRRVAPDGVAPSPERAVEIFAEIAREEKANK